MRSTAERVLFAAAVAALAWRIGDPFLSVAAAGSAVALRRVIGLAHGAGAVLIAALTLRANPAEAALIALTLGLAAVVLAKCRRPDAPQA
jgi:hypothetical protein